MLYIISDVYFSNINECVFVDGGYQGENGL